MGQKYYQHFNRYQLKPASWYGLGTISNYQGLIRKNFISLQPKSRKWTSPRLKRLRLLITTFMKEKGRGIKHAHPVERITPLGATMHQSVLMNGRITINRLYASKELYFWRTFSSPGNTCLRYTNGNPICWIVASIFANLWFFWRGPPRSVSGRNL